MRVQLLSPRRESAGDDGAVAIVVVFFVIIFAMLAAFAVDVGNAYAQKRQVSVSADSAALAAASELGNLIPPGTACTSSMLAALTDSAGHVGAVAIAKAKADAMNTANNRSGVSEPVASVTVTCVKSKPTDATENAVEVTVNNARQVNTVFAGVIGINKLTSSSYAVAHYIRAQTTGGLRPWAVCNDTVTQAQNAPDTTFWTAIDKTPGGAGGPCNTTAPGNWGAIDFDGGNNAAGDLEDWTQYGYPGAVNIPDPFLPADPGVTNSVTSALHSLVGQVVLFPVVTGFNGGGGNNASFNAVGIVTAKVCGIKYQNNTYTTDLSGNSSGCWVTPFPPTTNTSTTTVTANGGSITKNQDVLTTTDPKFTAAMAGDPNVTVTVPGADNGNPGDLVAHIKTYNSATSVVLDTTASKTVNNVAVTITTSTTTTSGGFGPYDSGGNLLNHIQFRWINYSTSSYSGTNPKPCDFTDRLCAGTTLLWR